MMTLSQTHQLTRPDLPGCVTSTVARREPARRADRKTQPRGDRGLNVGFTAIRATV